MSTTKTIICHLYNEEHLLPWWLNHHKKIFDYGILIDYASTDTSVEICKTICPHWHIVQSHNNSFDVANVDREIMYYESIIRGWKICLNVTEFIVGEISFNLLEKYKTHILIPQISFFDWNPQSTMDHSQLLWSKYKFGIDYKTNFLYRRARSLHSINPRYTLGRHFSHYNCEDLLIFHYANCISSPEMLKRRLQIQHRIPYKDKKANLGFQHHNYGLGLTEEVLYKQYINLLNTKMIKDQSGSINRYCSS